jgi:hypothetical protein
VPAGLPSTGSAQDFAPDCHGDEPCPSMMRCARAQGLVIDARIGGVFSGLVQ